LRVACSRYRNLRRPGEPLIHATTMDTTDTEIDCSQFRFRAVDHPADSLLEVRHVEVHEKSELEPRQLQIGKNLRNVNGQEFLDTFDFNYQAFFDDEIDAIRRRKSHALVFNWQMNLVLDVQASRPHILQQAGTNRALQNAGSERGVDSKRAIDDGVRRFI